MYAVILLTEQCIGTVTGALGYRYCCLPYGSCVYRIALDGGADIILTSKPSVTIPGEYMLSTDFTIFDHQISLKHQGQLGLMIYGDDYEYNIDAIALGRIINLGVLRMNGSVLFNEEKISTSRARILAAKSLIL